MSSCQLENSELVWKHEKHKQGEWQGEIQMSEEHGDISVMLLLYIVYYHAVFEYYIALSKIYVAKTSLCCTN